MTFILAIKRGFLQSFVWQGRAAPNEFWFFALFSVLCLALLGMIMDGLSSDLAEAALSVTVQLVLYVPLLAVLIRRLHDSGRHGGWFWIGFVPFIGWLLIIILLAKPSDQGANRFGPAPQPINTYATEPRT